MAWQVIFATIEDLWADENATPERGPIVVTEIEEDEFCTTQQGWARVGDEWYKVIHAGEGNWRACWSDRQQRFVIVQDSDFAGKLNEAAGLTTK